MDMRALRYAIADAERFVERAREALGQYHANYSIDSVISDQDKKTIRRLSLDVTHAMKDLRDSIDPVTSETTKTTATDVDLVVAGNGLLGS